MSDQKHLTIYEQTVEVQCPTCRRVYESEWFHCNAAELIHHYTCECGDEIEVLFQIGATLSTSSGTEEEAWL